MITCQFDIKFAYTFDINIKAQIINIKKNFIWFDLSFLLKFINLGKFMIIIKNFNLNQSN